MGDCPKYDSVELKLCWKCSYVASVGTEYLGLMGIFWDHEQFSARRGDGMNIRRRPKLVFHRRTIEMASPPSNPSAVEAPQSTRSFPTNFVRIALSLLPSPTHPLVHSSPVAPWSAGASLYSREQSQRSYHPVFNRAYAPGMSASRRTRYPVAASPSWAPRDDRY